MPPSVNVYSSEPALPVLAHTLLSPSESANPDLQTPAPSQDKTVLDAWDLKPDIDRGIRSSSFTILHHGKVIGFSRLRRDNDDDPHSIAWLPLHLLTTHLCNSQPSPNPTTFIIHPANFDAFAPKTLLASLLSSASNPGLCRDEAIQRLDSVQLLPVYDFRSAVQAINEVSDSLHRIQEREHLHSRNHKEAMKPTDPVVFIIAGLDTLAEGIIRASNPGKGAAVLMATLRTLTQLSRMHASFLSVVLVNTSGVGAVNPSAVANSGPGSGQDDPQSRDEGVHSIFRQSGTSLFPSLLLRTLDQGIDTHLLLSSERNTQIVEVIKDRVGDGVGRWCIWN